MSEAEGRTAAYRGPPYLADHPWILAVREQPQDRDLWVGRLAKLACATWPAHQKGDRIEEIVRASQFWAEPISDTEARGAITAWEEGMALRAAAREEKDPDQ